MNQKQHIWWLAVVLSSLFIAYGTLYPFAIGEMPLQTLLTIDFWWLRVHPKSPLGDVAANLLFFIPVGCSLGCVLSKTKFTWAWVLIYSAALSYFVECLQQVLPARNPSLFDVLVNTISGGLGWLLSLLFLRFVSNDWKVLKKGKWILPSILVMLLLVLDALQPFDFSLDIAMVRAEWHLLKSPVLIVHPGYYGIWWRQFIMIVLAAAIVCSWAVEQKKKMYGRKVLISLSILGLILEGLQFIVISRVPSLIDYLTYPLGTVAGLGLYRIVPRENVIWVALFWAAAGWALGMTVGPSWFNNGDVFYLQNIPYPFHQYYQPFLISKAFSYVLFFFPFGFLIPYWLVRGKKSPGPMMVGALFFVLSFALSVFFRQGFFAFVVSLRGGTVLLGLLLGLALSIAALRHVHGAHEKWNE